MADYPAQYTWDVVLRDGSTLLLRPIRPDDAPRLLDLYGRLSPDTIRFRFFRPPQVDSAWAERLASVDYDREFALVGELLGRLHAVARYVRNPEAGERAEVAFVIADALQGRGIGTQLLQRLADVARGQHITSFEAFVAADNDRMMDVLLDSGFEVEHRLDGGVFRVALSLERTAAFEAQAAARARIAARASMRAFFEPRSIAIVGASRTPGKIGAEIFRNVRKTGFRGSLVPVNPHAAEIDGVPAYARMVDVPGTIDLAIIVVPAEQVPAVVEDCIAKQTKAIVVISAGFGETGPEGRRREARLLEEVRGAGIRMIGPNCMGLLNTDPEVRLNGTFAPTYPPAGSVALSSQSGALGLAILDYARRLNIGISTFASIGNRADVSGNDLIQYWAEDPRTSVILLYLESLGNPVNFGEIARQVTRLKPIVAVKSGRSAAGARAASSHTGALAGSDRALDALFRQTGVIRVASLEELFDVAALLAHQPVPAGNRVGILTNAGGPGILAADACEANGLELPALCDATIVELRSFLPATASVANPVDMIASAPADAYRRAIRAMLADERLDSLLVIYIPPLVTDPEAVATAIVEGASEHGGKTVLASFMRASGTPSILTPIPCYQFPESAATALASATAYGAWRRRPVGTVPRYDDVVEADARSIIEAALRRGGGWLTPTEAQALLAVIGIPTATAQVAPDLEGALAAARAIGYPLALKAVGPAVVHKTEIGGLKLDLTDERELRLAHADLVARLGNDLSGVLVQQMVSDGIEMILGASRDAAFGPLILCGSGGTLLELVGDVALRVAPLTGVDASEMLDEVKGMVLLRGYRGAPPADEEALRDALLRVSHLVTLCPEIQEMDINPVKVQARGLLAVDVRVRVDHRTPSSPPRRISY